MTAICYDNNHGMRLEIYHSRAQGYSYILFDAAGFILDRQSGFTMPGICIYTARCQRDYHLARRSFTAGYVVAG